MRPASSHLTVLLAVSALLAVAFAPSVVASQEPAGGGLVPADDFTDTAGPLADGQIELRTLSTRAATVTGGDVLLAVRGVGADDTLTVTGPDGDLTGAFTAGDDPFGDDDQQWVGLVEGLPVGQSVVLARVEGPRGTRTAQLPIDNHPVTGPVFSGPHQELFNCRADGLEDFATPDQPDARPELLDQDCSIAPYVRWYYLSTSPPDGLPFDPADPEQPDQVPYDTADWVPLTDPYGEYPADVATTVTTEGEVVPAIARVETRTINRGIARVAILDDPAARGPDAPFDASTTAWNERFLYNWGASCGIGRDQGDNTPSEVLSGGVDAGGEALDVGPEALRPAVLEGYVVAHNSMTIFNTHCNQVLSAETFMMTREHVTEQYGQHDWVMGNGASGGAIQQYAVLNQYPGLLDGGIPLVSFPDVVTTAMSPVDCRLLRQVFQLADGANPQVPGSGREVWTGSEWNLAQQNAITGHLLPGICEDWDNSFADLVVADEGCRSIPGDRRYDRALSAADNLAAGNERCTLQDNLVDLLGTGDDGYARLPYDNTGVQYGLQALLDGDISAQQFLDLNRLVGSPDAEGYGPWDPDLGEERDPSKVQPRTRMDADLADDLYAQGFVTGRGALDQAPIIDTNLYADPVPILGFHDQVRTYMSAERIRETYGHDETHTVWSGVVLNNDAWATMHEWLDGLEASRTAAGGVSDDWSDDVVAARPVNGDDACVVTTAGYGPTPVVAPGTAGTRDDACEQVFDVKGSPRIVAGGPTTEDIIACQLTAPDRAAYGEGTFTDEQWDQLTTIFADGVCDYGVDGIGEVERSATWLDHGDDQRGALDQPVVIPHVVARS